MLVQIVTENGQKKVIPLTADAGAGNPVGTIIAMYKKSNPSGFLYLDGRDTTGTSEELSTHYPILYAILGSNVLPDYREFALVGAEENTTDVYNASTNPNGTIHDHDVYTEGQAKDDQLQDHEHKVGDASNFVTYTQGAIQSGTTNFFNVMSNTASIFAKSITSGRHGTVTRGKRKAVYFYIKATSGLSENAQDNVVAQLNEQRSYSTEEHLTGKKWIDGKPIYSKTLELTLPSSGTGRDIADLSGLNIDTVVNMIGVILNNTDDFIILNGCYSFGTDNIILFIRKTNSKLYFYRNDAAFTNGAPLKFTVEYTKTTD